MARIIKSKRELKYMREAGRMVAEVLALMKEMVEPGVTTQQLNAAAGRRMAELGGEPSFLGYRGFPANICVSINEEVVHGIPGGCQFRGSVTADRTLVAGDVVSIDCGVIHRNYHGDSAVTLPVGAVPSEIENLLRVGREAMHAGIRAMHPASLLSDVSGAIEKEILGNGEFGIVEEYVGHGIGRSLHEDPQVPNYVSASLRRNDVTLTKGLVLALEPMVNLGSRHVETLSDGWTVVTKDRKYSVHFEHTIAITEDGPVIFTTRGDGSATH